MGQAYVTHALFIVHVRLMNYIVARMLSSRRKYEHYMIKLKLQVIWYAHNHNIAKASRKVSTDLVQAKERGTGYHRKSLVSQSRLECLCLVKITSVMGNQS